MNRTFINIKSLASAIALTLLLAVSAGISAEGASSNDRLTEPYKHLQGKTVGKRIPFSPDPLVNHRWESPKAGDDLEIYTLLPVSVTCNTENAANWTSQGEKITVSADCDIMFDFGQVNAAWLEFDCNDLHGAGLQASISEFNEPAVFNAGSEHPKKTAEPIRYGKSYRLELNKELYEGARYAWIHLTGVTKPVVIKNVRLVCQTKPVNYEGSFGCNLPLLNRIWYTAAYTVRLNLMKEYFGAILMERSDRHSWTGDAHTSQAAAMVAFGNYDFVRKNIYNTAEQYNGIVSYSLYWVLSLIDYYMYTGDVATLDDLTDNVCYKLEMAHDHTVKMPSISFYGWDERLGAFENPDMREPRTAYRALSIQAWRKFADVMEKRGQTDLAKHFNEYADEQAELMRRMPDWYKGLGIFAISDAVNGSVIVPEEYDDIWQETFSDRLQRISYSPFNQYFVINAMSRMGRYGEAINTIDDCWGGQLRYGATTFFEVFRPSWNLSKLAENDAPVNNQCGYTSFTHPWSAGVAKWLSEEILGIKPLLPGFELFEVRPHLTDSLLSVNGTVPTLKGNINFSIDTEAGKASINIPEGEHALLYLPLMGSRIRQITVDGKEVAPEKSDKTHVMLPELAEGQHSITFSYEGTVTSPMTEEVFAYRYPASSVSEDTKTQGNWRGVYGSKGYMLFNYDRSGANRVALPEGCSNIKLFKNGNTRSQDCADDPRALLSDREGDNSRSLGLIYTQDPAPCMQTMTIDVDYRTGKPYKLSLYMVDWDSNGRRSAIEVFNLDDKKLLTPVHIVRSYEMGKYVTFELNEPVRIRIDQVRGDNASCAGIFID